MSHSQHQTRTLRGTRLTTTIIITLLIALGLALFVSLNKTNYFTAKVKAATSCPTSAPTGSSSVTANVTVTGDYNIWSRMKIPASNNSFYLKIDSTCYKVVGTNLSANQWGWINFENGSSGATIKPNLQAGNHTVSVIGNESDVKVDRLIFTVGSCVPSGTGDACAVPVDSPPTVTLDSPTAGTTLTGVTKVSSTAVDDTSISKVDFFVDSSTTPFKSITAPPYSFDWDPSTVANGAHTLKAKAYDSVNQTADASAAVDVQVAPPTPTGTVYIAVPVEGDTLSGKDVILSAGTTNLSSVSKVEYFLDDSVNLGSAAPTIYGWIVHWDSTLVANGSHKLIAKATAGTTVTASAPINITVSNTGDTLPPSVPGNIRLKSAPTKTSATIVWNASTDNSGGRIKYYIYLNDKFKWDQKGTIAKFNYLTKGTTYTAKVVAVDETGNQSLPASLTFKTKSFCLTKSVCVY